jgi:hypothetical protein
MYIAARDFRSARIEEASDNRFPLAVDVWN